MILIIISFCDFTDLCFKWCRNFVYFGGYYGYAVGYCAGSVEGSNSSSFGSLSHFAGSASFGSNCFGWITDYFKMHSYIEEQMEVDLLYFNTQVEFMA